MLCRRFTKSLIFHYFDDPFQHPLIYVQLFILPYRTKIRRTKLSKFRLGVENFVRRKTLSVENFVQCFNTKVRQKSDKSVEISARCRKFCLTKHFVRRKFCSIFQYKSQVKIGQNCRNFGLVSKILSGENFVRRNFVR